MGFDLGSGSDPVIQSTFCLKMTSVSKLTSMFLVVIIIDSFKSISLRHCRYGYFPVIKHNVVSSSKCSPITFSFCVYRSVKLNCLFSTEDEDISKIHHEFVRTKHMPKMNPQSLPLTLTKKGFIRFFDSQY